MKRSPTDHRKAVEDILWCFDQGMDREQTARRLGYKSKSGVEQVITRERRYAKATGTESRL